MAAYCSITLLSYRPPYKIEEIYLSSGWILSYSYRNVAPRVAYNFNSLPMPTRRLLVPAFVGEYRSRSGSDALLHVQT